jgi:ribosomal protein L37AE/L43A
MSKKHEMNKRKIILKEKFFCPVCGSAAIRPNKKGFKCLNCKALFSKPKKTKIELRKTPRYIG